ncbi:MarR family transcriptional regulator [Robertmurraya massiliosenegalensis]|uniref:MarR family winged helix-turn-helix transcriptional regulator n=1 Tax=Robertmurraya TaxID=2837507 RepID=UPI0039A54B18
MTYKELANELFDTMKKIIHKPFQKKVEDITQGERRILGFLTLEGDGLTAGELSEKLHFSTPRIASVLKSLEKKGYIMRDRDPKDKRFVVVHITETGKSFVLEEHEKAMRMLEEILKNLGEKDTKELIRIMSRIVEITNKSEKGD